MEKRLLLAAALSLAVLGLWELLVPKPRKPPAQSPPAVVSQPASTAAAQSPASAASPAAPAPAQKQESLPRRSPRAKRRR